MQTVIAIHGPRRTSAEASLLRWWHETSEWASGLGLSPKLIGAGFSEKVLKLKKYKAYNLRRSSSRIEEALATGNVTSLELIRLKKGGEYLLADWSLYAVCGMDCFSEGALVVGLDLAEGDPVSQVSLGACLKHVFTMSLSYIQCQYGYAVTMPRLFMPIGYPSSFVSEAPDEFIYDANTWAKYAGKECDRSIRNVLGHNILNARHLDIRVGRKRLGDWIAASSRRGRIESLGDDLFLWTFQKGDDQEAYLRWDYPSVVAVREKLKRHRIFPWQRFREDE